MSRARGLLAVAVSITALLALPGLARAAIVTNGDFETGNLGGWQDASQGPGDWFAYSGNSSPISGFTIQPPPQGAFAAVADQTFISRQVLYQDLTLPPVGSAVRLHLLAYYTSRAPIVAPDSLDVTTTENEQYRIDVMKPGASIYSVAPGDVLVSVFRTPTGAPQSMGPTLEASDLSAFAGQTVRLRLAVATTDDVLNGSADAIAVNGLTVGKPKLNKHNGTAKLPATVTDPGTVSLTGKGVKKRSASANGGTVKLPVTPKGKTKRKLDDSGKAKVKVTVTYTPTGGSPLSENKKLKLKKS